MFQFRSFCSQGQQLTEKHDEKARVPGTGLGLYKGHQMKKTLSVKYLNKIIAATSLLLVTGLYASSASASIIPSESNSQVAETADFDSSRVTFHSNETLSGKEDDKGLDRGTVAVPEAGTFMLLGAGFFGLAVFTKRRQCKG